MGRILDIAERLLRADVFANLIVLAANNGRLKQECEDLKKTADNKNRLRVLGWTDRIPELFRAADILVSKLGNTFDEAIASSLPIIAMPPPPGAEQVQYELIEKLGIGRSVKTVGDVVAVVMELLEDGDVLRQMRSRMLAGGRHDAAEKLALWLRASISA